MKDRSSKIEVVSANVAIPLSINKDKSFYSHLYAKCQDYLQLIKFRLTVLVVFSSAMAFLFASTTTINWSQLGLLLLSGFLITGSANGLNQIIEKDLDILMTRTADRPVASNRMKVSEAVFITGIMGIAGIVLLQQYMNNVSAMIGLTALLSYAFLYTPLKQKTAFAVLVGAFPGALPVMIGYTAVTGEIDTICVLLFLIQFFWQFPHFWAIAWILDEDYKKAGFNLLPSKGGKNKSSAFQTFVYTLILIPVSLMPAKFGLITLESAVLILLCGLIFLYQSVQLLRTCSNNAARQLMLGSFLYLPIVQVVLVFGKLI